jgi:hypothetical protein
MEAGHPTISRATKSSKPQNPLASTPVISVLPGIRELRLILLPGLLSLQKRQL